MSTGLSGTYATPLRLEPVSTPHIGLGLLSVYGCAALIAALLPLPLSARCLLELWLLLPLIGQWNHHVRRTSPRCIKAVTWKEGRECRVLLCNGEQHDVTLGRSAFVQPWLVILHFHGPGRGRQYLLLLPGMLDCNSYRRLRVRLRMELR
jgi:hypothetical protein